VSGGAGATSASALPVVDDAQLIAAICRAEPSAARAFYHRVRPIVDRTLTRLLGANDAEYEDAAQLAFVQLVQAIAKFRQDCPLDAWVSVLTARVVYRLIRERRRERQIFSGLPFDELAATAPRTSGKVISGQILERMRRHLEGMDERRAWTYLLHDVYGYELKEIATILNISVSAAQSRLVRGRGELHERVAADPDLSRYLDDFAKEEALS